MLNAYGGRPKRSIRAQLRPHPRVSPLYFNACVQKVQPESGNAPVVLGSEGYWLDNIIKCSKTARDNGHYYHVY